MGKIIRTICVFTKEPNQEIEDKLSRLEKIFADKGYTIQTKRICSPQKSFSGIKSIVQDKSILLSIGSLNYEETKEKIDDFIKAKSVAFNLDLTNEKIKDIHSNILFKIINKGPASTFSFAYTFNNPVSSPYFPSAVYEKDGFAIGLQPTDLAVGCNSIQEWLDKIKECWEEIISILEMQEEFLGIDSSIAPLFMGQSSLVNFVRRLYPSFNESVLTDIFLQMARFIKDQNPKPIGLCGLMLPCLEDFELAEEYEIGNFSVERNIFLSLHSGLGIDTYPIGVNEDVKKVTNILKTVQELSNKYKKPLSVRFVSDGIAKIGEKTNFQNQYLKDITIRRL
ncbi:MAG: DUF711 family protein [Candidatus Woesearchaeota archaeon]